MRKLKLGQWTATVVITVEVGKVKGSKWVVMGNAEILHSNTASVNPATRNHKAFLDLTNLSKFVFLGDDNSFKG